MNISRNNLLISLVVSALIGGGFTLGQSIIFGGGAIYLYDEDYAKVDDMNYSEARDYFEKRTKEISGYESFFNGLKYPHFWKQIVQIWLYYTIMCLLSCLVYSAFSRRNTNAI